MVHRYVIFMSVDDGGVGVFGPACWGWAVVVGVVVGVLAYLLGLGRGGHLALGGAGARGAPGGKGLGHLSQDHFRDQLLVLGLVVPDQLHGRPHDLGERTRGA